MFWWWKIRLSAGGARRQGAIDHLVTLLFDESEDCQRKTATLLAGVGHPLAAIWLLKRLGDRDRAEQTARLLEQMVTDFSDALEIATLQSLAVVSDPLQNVRRPVVGRNGKLKPSHWSNYASLDCSALREKALTELQRRAEAETQWSRADEELQQNEERNSEREVHKIA